MKKLLKILWYLVYHKTDDYTIKQYESPDLHYTQYQLFRIDKVFFITVKKHIDTASNINENKKNNWYLKYNLKNI